MTPELIAIIAVGMALAALMLRQGAWFDKRFEKVYERFDKLDERFDRLDARFDKLIGRFKNLEGRMTQMVEKQQASLEGLREAATCNRSA